MDDPETDRITKWSSGASDSLVDRVLQFAQLVRSHGIAVTSGRIIDAQRSLQYIDVGRRDDFYHALRANLIARPEDISGFDALFESFWRASRQPESNSEDLKEEHARGQKGSEEARTSASPARRGAGPRKTVAGDEEREAGVGYSALEVLIAKDFSTLDASELHQIQEVMARMAPRVLMVRSRRYRQGTRGSRLDFPRTLRQSLHTGGDVIDLSWRKRRADTARLLLLCDVSRSMEKYSRFLIQFMYAFQNELPSTETFVFSTRLTRLTGVLRGQRLDVALEGATSASTGWSSGTKIGECLQQFNNVEGSTMLDRRTVVVILSDGWDQGDPWLLGDQIASIKRRVRLVVWLNPLLGNAGYRPLVSGMCAALPHIDLFLPCHNLASLQAFATALRRM